MSFIKLVSVKSIFLLIKYFLCVLKMFSLWTFLHEIIVVFFLIKILQFLKIEAVCAKKEIIMMFITLKTDETHFLSNTYVSQGKKTYLKCSWNFSIRKKWHAKISMFFYKSPGFLRFLLKFPGSKLCKVGRSALTMTTEQFLN